MNRSIGKNPNNSLKSLVDIAGQRQQKYRLNTQTELPNQLNQQLNQQLNCSSNQTTWTNHELQTNYNWQTDETESLERTERTNWIMANADRQRHADYTNGQ